MVKILTYGSSLGPVSYTHQGAVHLIKQEKSGCYPGEQAYQRKRAEILTRHVRPVSFACLRQGDIQSAWDLYQSTFSWHFQLKRFRYLIAFPIFAASNWSFRSLKNESVLS
jgi:hypothetical protein